MSTLGINGLGRIGKLTVWHHVQRKHFDKLAVNLGREVGTGLEAVCGAIERDSTYGSMHRFLFGVSAEPCIKIIDREQRLLEIAGVPVTVLLERDSSWTCAVGPASCSEAQPVTRASVARTAPGAMRNWFMRIPPCVWRAQ